MFFNPKAQNTNFLCTEYSILEYSQHLLLTMSHCLIDNDRDTDAKIY